MKRIHVHPYNLHQSELTPTCTTSSVSFASPLLTFAISAEGELSGWIGLWSLLDVQIPHVVLVRGPRLQGLEEPLVTGRIFPCELQAALHTLNACKQLQKRTLGG